MMSCLELESHRCQKEQGEEDKQFHNTSYFQWRFQQRAIYFSDNNLRQPRETIRNRCHEGTS